MKVSPASCLHVLADRVARGKRHRSGGRRGRKVEDLAQPFRSSTARPPLGTRVGLRLPVWTYGNSAPTGTKAGRPSGLEGRCESPSFCRKFVQQVVPCEFPWSTMVRMLDTLRGLRADPTRVTCRSRTGSVPSATVRPFFLGGHGAVRSGSGGGGCCACRGRHRWPRRWCSWRWLPR